MDRHCHRAESCNTCPSGTAIGRVWPFGRLRRVCELLQHRTSVKDISATVVVAVVLAVGSAGSPAHARAAAPDRASTRGPRGDVDVDMADDAAEAALRAEVAEWYGEQKAAIAEMVGAGVRVQAVVEVRDFDPELGLGYAGVLVVRLDDAHHGERFEVRAGCPCSSEEFFAIFSAAVESRVGDWMRVRDLKVAAKPPEPVAPAPSAALPPERYQLDTLGKAGIGAIGVGAVFVIAGAVMWGRGVAKEPPPRFPGLRDGGIALVGVGAAVTAIGVGYLVADVVLDRRWRRSLRPSGGVGPTGGVLGLRGRF